MRYRPRGGDSWSFKLTHGDIPIPIRLNAGLHEAQLAYLRHPIEAETPGALNWGETELIERLSPPQNLTATATHDTVTVAFDDQRGYWGAMVSLALRDGSGNLLGLVQRSYYPTWSEIESGDRHELTFAHLPPATRLTVRVNLGVADLPGTSASTTVTTQPAPANWTPPPSGPQNLSAVATHNSITVSWDAPYQDDAIGYFLQVFEASSGRHIASRYASADQRQWVTYGGHFERLKPNTRYRVLAQHEGIPTTRAEVFVTTRPLTAAGDTHSGSRGSTEIPGLEPFPSTAARARSGTSQIWTAAPRTTGQGCVGSGPKPWGCR